MTNGKITLAALFSDSESLVEAAKTLSGRGHGELEALSPVPVPELEHALSKGPSNVRWFTLAGCVIGGVLGMAFQIATVMASPIWVGGKPIISLPAFLVVSFEMTILFGAIATLTGLMLNARLPLIGKGYYHRGCSQSDFALLVRLDPDEQSTVEALLLETGAREVQTSEPQSLLLGVN